MPATITQKRIAEYAGVSPVLVSRALSAHPSVAIQTRERIEAAARALGYGAHTNQGAREMAARRHGKRIPTDIIAVLMQVSFFAGIALPRLPFFAPFIEGIHGDHSTVIGLSLPMLRRLLGELGIRIDELWP